MRGIPVTLKRLTALAVIGLLFASGLGLALNKPQASALNCSSRHWPGTGSVDTSQNNGSYTALFRFKLSADELCSLQALNKFLEIDFALQGFATPGGWDSYTLSTNLPGGIKDTAAGDPANQPTPAVTGVDNSRLQAGKEYYAAISWKDVPIIINTPRAVIYRWVPSHWAGNAPYVTESERIQEVGYCNVGIAKGNDAWCYFPNKNKTAPLLGSSAFTNGFKDGKVPLGNRSFVWSPDSANRPVLKEVPQYVPSPMPGNKLPIANFSMSRVAGSGNKLALNGGSSYDPDGSISSWTWYRNGQVIATGKTPTVSLGSTDSATITLNVVDNGGASGSVTKSISTPNRAPYISSSSPGNGSISGSNTPTLSVGAGDDDADALQYSFRITGPYVDISSGWVGNSWKVPASRLEPGSNYSWSVTVKDAKGATASRTSNFTVAMLPTANEHVSLSTGNGYWEVAGDGGVFSYGAAQFYGSLPGVGVRVNNIIGMARTPTDKGYWLVGKDGGVFAFGDAQYFGSLPSLNVRVGNIVGMAPTKNGQGYWLVGSDGGVFAFGNAGFYGSMGGKPLNKPVQAIAPTASSAGYWLAAEDGGVFAFGDAPFYGSMGGQALNYPVVDIDATPDGKGYWLAAQDGGIFAFGNARFHGSMAGKPLNGHINSMSITPDGGGYWLNGCDGGIFSFGNAPFYGSQPRYGCRGIWY